MDFREIFDRGNSFNQLTEREIFYQRNYNSVSCLGIDLTFLLKEENINLAQIIIEVLIRN